MTVAGIPHIQVEPGEICPTCDRRIPVAKEDRTPRKRAQLNIAVPADAENGVEILRSLFAAARDKLAEAGALVYGKDVPPYHVIIAVFHDWLT